MVFVGYNPAIFSAEAGHYYARPGNVFWRQLSESGLVARSVRPEDDALLMDEAGIGFTDLCCRPTVRASELRPDEIAAGARRLHTELVANGPAVAVFSGRGIYQHFGRHALGLPPRELAQRAYGPQPDRLPHAPSLHGAGPADTVRTVPWVIPSSSGLASKWHRERLAWLRRLADALG
jgi:TDG/mug DNA glycosylase family protein